jgi:hypothetical protein
VAVHNFVLFFADAGRVVTGGRRQYKLLILEQEHLDDGDLDRITETGVLVTQRHLRFVVYNFVVLKKKWRTFFFSLIRVKYVMVLITWASSYGFLEDK